MMLKIKCLMLTVLLLLLCNCQSNYSNTYRPDTILGLDTYIDQSNPTKNFSDKDHLSISIDSLGKETRSLLKIRCASIPERTRVDSAFLYLYVYKTQNLSSPFSVRMDRIIEGWDIECVTWDNQPKTDKSLGLKVKVNQQDLNYYKIDVTDFITSIADKTYLNYGLSIAVDRPKNANKSIGFFSSNTKYLDSSPILKVYFNQNSI